MAFEQILYEVVDRIGTITLNRPDRLNAWTVTMMEELIKAFDEANMDDNVRAIIVTGATASLRGGANTAAFAAATRASKLPASTPASVLVCGLSSSSP